MNIFVNTFGRANVKMTDGEIAEKICAEEEDLEVEIENGGQPVYYYFISVE